MQTLFASTFVYYRIFSCYFLSYNIVNWHKSIYVFNFCYFSFHLALSVEEFVRFLKLNDNTRSYYGNYLKSLFTASNVFHKML